MDQYYLLSIHDVKTSISQLVAAMIRKLSQPM